MMIEEDRPIRSYPSDGLPPTPELGHDIYADLREKEPHVGSRLKAFIASLVVVGLLVAVVLGFMFLEPATQPKPSPSVSPALVVITKADLNAKMDRVAFYLGRGQVEGAKQVLDDMLVGSDCAYATSGAGAYKTQRYALKVARLWSHSVANAAEGQTPEGYHIVIGTGIAKAEDGGKAVAQVLSAAEGPWISAGVALYCPDA